LTFFFFAAFLAARDKINHQASTQPNLTYVISNLLWSTVVWIPPKK
jgi:hypothetical protein